MFKQIIKVKVLTEGCLPEVSEKGDWVDLKSAISVNLQGPEADTLKKHKNEKYRKVKFGDILIPLGVAMQLPEGMEAHIVARSSIYKNWKSFLVNSIGIIDGSYCGPKDQWKAHIVALDDTDINVHERICQFRIMPSQKATFLQKLKWLFSDGIEIVEVDELDNNNREGFGSTGRL